MKLVVYTEGKQEVPIANALTTYFGEMEWGEYVEVKPVIMTGLVLVEFPEYVDGDLYAEGIEGMPYVRRVQRRGVVKKV